MACDFSLLMLGITWFMGISSEQSNIILLINFGLHFNFILVPGPHLFCYHMPLIPLEFFSDVIRQSDRHSI